MNLKISYFTCFILLLIVTACSNSKELEPLEYVKWVENTKNELNKTKQIKDIVYELQYCPVEYILLKEYRTPNISKKLINDRKKDSLLHFKLRISESTKTQDVLNYELSNPVDYYSRVDYLSYGFEEDLYLVKGTDTISPAVFHFERSYGITPFIDLIFAFRTSTNTSNNMTLKIDDRLFNNGIINFNYSNTQFNNIPYLKTN